MFPMEQQPSDRPDYLQFPVAPLSLAVCFYSRDVKKLLVSHKWEILGCGKQINEFESDFVRNGVTSLY